MTEILKTQNKEWGFGGTGKYYLQHKSDIKKLWDETAKLIQEHSGLTPEETQKLMDSPGDDILQIDIWKKLGRMSKHLSKQLNDNSQKNILLTIISIMLMKHPIKILSYHNIETFAKS